MIKLYVYPGRAHWSTSFWNHVNYLHLVRVKFCYFFGANVQRLHCKAQVSQLRNRCQIIRRTLNCDWLLTFVVCFIIQCDNCSHCCWSSAHWPKPVSTATGKFYWQFLLVIFVLCQRILWFLLVVDVYILRVRRTVGYLLHTLHARFSCFASWTKQPATATARNLHCLCDTSLTDAPCGPRATPYLPPYP